MSETSLGTPQNQNPKDKIPHSGVGGVERPVHDFRHPDGRQMTIAEAIELGLLTTTAPDTIGDHKDPSSDRTPQYRHLTEEDRADNLRDGLAHRHSRRKVLGWIAATTAVLATGGGVAYVATRPSGPTTTTPSAPATPDYPPTPEDTPSPEPTETVEQVDSDLPVAERYLKYSPDRFKELSLTEAMLAIDAQYLTQPATMYQYQSPVTTKKEDQPYNGTVELYDYAPSVRAANSTYAGVALSPEDILDTVVFERAAVVGQTTDPSDYKVTEMDHDMAARMMRGLYYDVDSQSANSFWNLVKHREEVFKFTHDDRPKYLSSSDTVLNHDFGGNIGNVPYIVINYFDPAKGISDQHLGKRWMIVSPVITSINAPNPYESGPDGPATSIKEIQHYLIVQEGNGTKDPDEALE